MKSIGIGVEPENKKKQKYNVVETYSDFEYLEPYISY